MWIPDRLQLGPSIAHAHLARSVSDLPVRGTLEANAKPPNDVIPEHKYASFSL
jgi:hypothetical protein